MIHICTVHWKTGRWIDLQVSFIKRFVRAPFRIYSFCSEISEQQKEHFFFHSLEDIKRHETKLNLLSEFVWFCRESDDDLLLFLDGDAFPIGDIVAFAGEKMRQFPLLAVQRKENMGDIQPHPSFCLTTVGFWKSIQGTWDRGRFWQLSDGRWRTDVGGKLLDCLEATGSEWYPLIRSNAIDLHPLYFGIYDNVVYHHGAAFRRTFSTSDIQYLPFLLRFYSRILPKLPRRITRYIEYGRKIRLKNDRLSEKVFEYIQNDPVFYNLFMETGSREHLADRLGIDRLDLPPLLKSGSTTSEMQGVRS